MLNRIQIKNEIKRIQEVMDSQEISLLNHIEELKQAEARERLNRFKNLKEETKNILKADPESQGQSSIKKKTDGSTQRRPKSAGRPTDQGQTFSQTQGDQVHARFANIKNRQDIYLHALNQVAAIISSNMQQSQLGGLLQRICGGLSESQASFMNSLQYYINESKSVQDKQNEDLQTIVAQFAEFKKKNNLDEYFEKYLNASTRE